MSEYIRFKKAGDNLGVEVSETNPLPISHAALIELALAIVNERLNCNVVELHPDIITALVAAQTAATQPVSQSQATTVPARFVKTVAATGTPEALAADGTFFRTAIFRGNKATRTPNVTVAYLGVTATDDEQSIILSPGEEVTITAPPGQKYDLNDWYLDVTTAADGVVVVYS